MISEDTDVFVILLGMHSEIRKRILLRRRKKNQIRLIDISKLGTALGKEVCEALLGVHAWTGCDSVTSFAGKGNVKAVDLIRKNEQFRNTFVLLGQSEEPFDVIQEFICSMQHKGQRGE